MVFVRFHDLRVDAKFEMDLDFTKFKTWAEMGQSISGIFNIEPSTTFRLVGNSGSMENFEILGLEDIESNDILSVVLADKSESITKLRQSTGKISKIDMNCFCCKNFISHSSASVTPSDNIIELVLTTKNNKSCSKCLTLTKSDFIFFQTLVQYLNRLFSFHDHDVYMEYQHKIEFSSPIFNLKLLFTMGTENETIPDKITPDIIVQSVLNSYDIKIYYKNSECPPNALKWPFYCETLQDFEVANNDLRAIIVKGCNIKVWIPESQLYLTMPASEVGQALPPPPTAIPSDTNILNYFQIHHNITIRKVENQSINGIFMFNCDDYSNLIQFVMNNNIIRIEGVLFQVSSSISQDTPVTRLPNQSPSSTNNTSCYSIIFSVVNSNESIPSKVTPENIILALQNSYEIKIQADPSKCLPNTTPWYFSCIDSNDYEKVKDIADPIIVKGCQLKVSIASTKHSLYFNYNSSDEDPIMSPMNYTSLTSEILEFYHLHYHIILIQPDEDIIMTEPTNNTIRTIHLLCDNYDKFNMILTETTIIKIKNITLNISTVLNTPNNNNTTKQSNLEISEELIDAKQLIYNGTIIVSSKSKKEILIQPENSSDLQPHPSISLFISSTFSYAMLVDAIINSFSLPKATRLTLYTSDKTLFLHNHMVSLVDGTHLIFKIDTVISEDLRVTVRDHNNIEFMIDLPVTMNTEGQIHWLLNYLKLTGLATVSKYGTGRPLTAFDAIACNDVLIVTVDEDPVKVEYFNLPDISPISQAISLIDASDTDSVLIPVEVFLLGISSSSGLSTDIKLRNKMTLEELNSLLLSPWKQVLALSQTNIRTKIVLGNPSDSQHDRKITTVEIFRQAYEDYLSLSSTVKNFPVTIILESSAVIVFVSFIKLYENESSSNSNNTSLSKRDPMVIDRYWNWMKVLDMIVNKENAKEDAIKIVSVTSSDGVYHNDCMTLRTGDTITIILDDADHPTGGVEESKVEIGRPDDDFIISIIDDISIGDYVTVVNNFGGLTEFERKTLSHFQEFGISLTENQLHHICSKFSNGTDINTIIDYYYSHESEMASLLLPIPPDHTSINNKSKSAAQSTVPTTPAVGPIHFPPVPPPLEPRTNNNNLNGVMSSPLFEELLALGYDPDSVRFVLEITQNKDDAIEYLGGDAGRRNIANTSKVGSSSNNNSNNNQAVAPKPIQLPAHLEKDPRAQELAAMGYTIDDITEALKRSSTVEAAIIYLIDRYSMEEEKEEAICRCTICLDDFPASKMYTLECCYNHRFCYPCLLRHAKTALSSVESPHLPACPYANQKDADMNDGCNYLITERELNQIIELASLAPQWDDPVPNFYELGKKVTSLYKIKAHRDNGHIRCSGCTGTNDEGFWFDLPQGNDRMHVTCPRCHTSFCGRCNANPYHYHCSCEDVIACSRAWIEWNNQGRQQYMSKLARDSEQHAAMLKQFNDRRAQYEREKKESEERHQELVRSEEWMRQTCKMCPSCSKVVYKVDGCDSMVCGRNYHGGDQQNGCGASFSWTAAPAYGGNAGAAKNIEFDAEQPADLHTVRHMITEGHPMLCDACSEPIVGPRLHCIHCSDYNLCVSCSMAGIHDPKHIFRVLFQNASTVIDNEFPEFEMDF